MKILVTEIDNPASGDEAICTAAARRLVSMGAEVTFLYRVSLRQALQTAGLDVSQVHLPCEDWFSGVSTADELVAEFARQAPALHRLLHEVLLRHDLVTIAPGGKYTGGLNNARALLTAAHALSAGIPVIVLHHSFGPIVNTRHRRLLAEVLTRCGLVLVRDDRSMEFLRELPISSERMIVCRDAVFSEDYPRPAAVEYELGINVRLGFTGHVNVETLSEFILAYKTLKPNARILVYSTTFNLDPSCVTSLMRLGCDVLPEMPKYPDYLRAVGRCAINVSDSFHGVLFSMMADRPVVCCQTDLRTWKLQGTHAPQQHPLEVLPGLVSTPEIHVVLNRILAIEANPSPVLEQQRVLVEYGRESCEDGWAAVASFIEEARGAMNSEKDDGTGSHSAHAVLLKSAPRESRSREPCLRKLGDMSAEQAPAQLTKTPGADHQTHLWIEPPEQQGDHVVLSARLKRPGEPANTLWYRVPRELEHAISPRADSFVLASIFLAMRAGCPVRVHGAAVSPSLLRNLEEFQAVWVAWSPEWYRAVPITGDVEEESGSPPWDHHEALVTFSGGLDSAFTLYRHDRQLCGRRSRPIGAALMVHGFDIPLSDEKAFQRAAERAGQMPRSLGVPLVTLATNLRELPHNWRDAHGPALASCLMLFQPKYSAGLIADSRPYEVMVYPYAARVFPYGSSPLTDPLLSSDSFQVIHDGADARRSDKVRLISEWSEARQFLRVCIAERRDRNCGRCEKCLRTLLSFKAMGLGRPECFENDVDAADIDRIRHVNPASFANYRVTLRQAKEASIAEPWVGALERLLTRQQGALHQLVDVLGREAFHREAALYERTSKTMNTASQLRREQAAGAVEENGSALDERQWVIDRLEAEVRTMRAGLEEKEWAIAGLREELQARLRVIEEQGQGLEVYRSAADERLRVIHQLEAQIRGFESSALAGPTT